jgi:hypothetical protein
MRGLGRTVRLCSCALVLIMAACGVFSVRDSESPDLLTESLTAWLNINALLRGTGATFEYADYEELFGSGFTYHQGLGRVHYADEVSRRLRDIEPLAPAVSWSRTSPVQLSTDSGVVTTIAGVRYEVCFEEGDSCRTAHTGNADFEVMFDLGRWVIVSWDDYPDVQVGEYSYFNPEYVDSTGVPP